jgi:hypothetical protein
VPFVEILPLLHFVVNFVVFKINICGFSLVLLILIYFPLQSHIRRDRIYGVRVSSGIIFGDREHCLAVKNLCLIAIRSNSYIVELNKKRPNNRAMTRFRGSSR